MTRTCRVSLAALLAAALFLTADARAATVTGSYAGVIASDSGLGLLGQTLRVDFSYDDSVAGSPSGAAFSYQDFLESLVVSVGANSWTFDGVDGFDFLFLYDDDVITFANGVEDRVSLSADVFTGPDLGTGTVNPSSYSFSLFLSDNVPFGSPDGLSAADMLPASAPVPELFSHNPGESANSMSFSWFDGDPEMGGDFFLIATNSVTTVPEPAAIWLLGTGILALQVMKRHRPG
jgi:hypothetical protein